MTTPGQPAALDPLSPTAGIGAGLGAGPVVLWALPALYARGLAGALAQAGHAPITTHQGQARPPVAAPLADRTTVVVAAEEVLAGRKDLAVFGGVAVAVVAVVDHADAAAFTAALSRGATGVLDATADLAHAVQVVAAAGAGLVVVPDHVARALASRAGATGAPALGPGERAWLRRLYTRLGAGGRTEALLAAERWGLLDQ